MSIIKKVVRTIKNNGIKGCIQKVKNLYQNEEKKQYYKWIKKNTPTKKELKQQLV